MILIFACATSDVLRTDLSLDDPGQPWICEIAAELIDAQGNPLASFWSPVKSEGRKIRDGAAAVHGISSRDAAKRGISEISALGMLVGLAAQARYAVGHGIQFDKDVVTSLLMRLGKKPDIWTRPGLSFLDTMIPATAACKIPSEHESGTYKWPSLDEAGTIILGEEPRDGHHSARDDVQRTKRLFLELKRQNLIEVVL